ncbi:hypothetical protein ElyMa_003673900 [Elysia marginata]|uniref:Uncharacterized protein n=1 Tax=Elysia marginata TaxID=1093978 RepID=A0AAV4F0Q6_9GAST|nr:hypothetical protein ElyMa_003673900 [Elysia marginata]
MIIFPFSTSSLASASLRHFISFSGLDFEDAISPGVLPLSLYLSHVRCQTRARLIEFRDRSSYQPPPRGRLSESRRREGPEAWGGGKEGEKIHGAEDVAVEESRKGNRSGVGKM